MNCAVSFLTPIHLPSGSCPRLPRSYWPRITSWCRYRPPPSLPTSGLPCLTRWNEKLWFRLMHWMNYADWSTTWTRRPDAVFRQFRLCSIRSPALQERRHRQRHRRQSLPMFVPPLRTIESGRNIQPSLATYFRFDFLEDVFASLFPDCSVFQLWLHCCHLTAV